MSSQTKISLKGLWMIIALGTMIIAACGKMDGTYKEFIKDGEIRYSQKPDTLGIQPGRNRVKAWLAAKRMNVSKFKIYWNDRLDSVEVPVTGAFDTDTLSVIIDNMEEGSYIFEFFTFDREGNTSLVVDTVGEVFGEAYASSLSNRLISRSTLGNRVRISWYAQFNEDDIRTEVRYKSQEGTENLIIVKASDMETIIDEAPLEGSLEYRTVFLPHPNAIDTFYTDYLPITLTPQPPEIYDGFPEDFEDTRYTKTNTTSAEDVEVGSGLWRFDKFIISRNNNNERKNGNGTIRSHTDQSIFEMRYDLPNGASKISFYHTICSADGASTFKVQASRDGGITWEDISDVYTNTSSLMYREIPLDIEEPVRFRFVKFATANCSTTNCRMNLDDIAIYVRD
ncbi:DUF4998 domain-containing protein [Sphingobacterium chuzhouense]|uniref:DUF4998 domain-containing protein n=1 Tax=Sphingobacterium chuzhouense TaxID=1742264 RepID=A0ABR7XQQ9_9SPHI|nr:DUF4998 domain-containing protein [Sphingobacterium chuzhouense]MBD1421490.1 DUF4998 domain-containing protein [Sphingobacterium chuzhouense]